MTSQPSAPSLSSILNAFGLRAGEDIWVFAYGSLMWNPEFEFEQAVPASVCGYHRRFCLKCDHHRGKPDRHGLVLGLDRGGSCRGLAYKIAPANLYDALLTLWKREMWVEDVYLPKRIPVTLNTKTRDKILACAFVSNSRSPYYFGETCRKKAAAIIAGASGLRGSNFEYLEKTVRQLRENNIHDRQLEDIYRHAQTSENALLT